VKIILEWNVYRTPWINNDTIKKLKNNNIETIYADNIRYNFTHIKLWIIDMKWCTGTGNWSYSAFTQNRDFIFCSENQDIMVDLEEIFLADFHHKRPYFPDGLDPRIGLSPENIRTWLDAYIESAQKSIVIYNQSVTDRQIIEKISMRAQSWVSIEVCQAYRNENTFSEAPFPWSIVSYMSKKPYLHAKIFLIDGKRILLWSANLTENALDNNREILVDIWENEELYHVIFSLYQKDCKGQL
jgi:cardiolipin synthase A/B